MTNIFCIINRKLNYRAMSEAGYFYLKRKLCPLSNLPQIGSQGVFFMTSGVYVRTEEYKRKLKLNHVGMLGKKHSEKSKIKMSLIQKGCVKPTGKLATAWKGGKVKTGLGYVQIHNPTHPYAQSKGYVYEHRLVMENHIGRYLKPEEIIHHINGIVDDNRIENLMLFANKAKHNSYEKLKRGTI